MNNTIILITLLNISTLYARKIECNLQKWLNKESRVEFIYEIKADVSDYNNLFIITDGTRTISQQINHNWHKRTFHEIKTERETFFKSAQQRFGSLDGFITFVVSTDEIFDGSGNFIEWMDMLGVWKIGKDLKSKVLFNSRANYKEGSITDTTMVDFNGKKTATELSLICDLEKEETEE